MAYQVYREGYEDDYWTDEEAPEGCPSTTEESVVDFWPLLDIAEAMKDCDRTLTEIVDDVETLVAETDDAYPPDAGHLLATLAAMRALLADLMTPALAEAIAGERTRYEADMAHWEAGQP
jgi:hypothetical protein